MLSPPKQPLSSSHALRGDELPQVSGALPGARSSAWCDILSSVECPSLTARRARRAERSGASHDPIVWSNARGALVQDEDNNLFLDLTAGFGAALIGHTHPVVVQAVQTQASRMLHALGDVYPSVSKIRLEQRLATMSPWGERARVILGLSGSDAIEAALKTAMLQNRRPGVLAFEGGYHGLSHGPLALCGYSHAFREPFHEQLNAHVHFVPYPVQHDKQGCEATLRAVENVLSSGQIGAFVFEPILGRGGVRVGDVSTLQRVLEMCAHAGVCSIADEIYTGCFRASADLCVSGRWDVKPDVVCLGKALGGGLPISACIMHERVARAWGDPGGEAIHTSTFLGNPLACEAALAVLDAFETDVNLLQARARVIDRLWTGLRRVADTATCGITHLEGAGLLLGLRLRGGLARTLRVMRRALELGVIVLPGGVAGDGLTLTPSLAMTDPQIEHACEVLARVLTETP